MVLRLWNLENEELWHDELLSIVYASQSLFHPVNAIEYLKEIKGVDFSNFLSYFPFSELILSTIFYDPHPPLFYVQLHFGA
ncbi:MAG: hypothetical protein H6613_16410 [Ignavibacteriales bacterium]|nr:hypothetical protein [Ignavibacteriales bacterium]